MKRNVLNSPKLLELKKKRRQIFLNKIILSLFLFFAAFTASAFLSNISALSVKDVKVTGNKVIDAEKIEHVARQAIEEKYLWVFPKTNILLYPKNSLKNKLVAEFPRLQSVDISISGEKTMEISVSEREALYTWCGESLPSTESIEQKCFFVDRSGFIFDESPYFSGEVYFKFYGLAHIEGKLPDPSVPSVAYFSPEAFQKFTLFKQTFEIMDLKPVALYAKENGEIRIFLSSQTAKKGPEIIFKIDSDFQKVAENLEAALGTEPLKSNFKDKYNSLLYIDLRFGNKVYYKFEQ